ncbi:MAG TPA: protease modulator HflC [Roseiarcus sp.]|nr:protease modulator HflC [Roseiarcus sp.]
MKRPLVIGSLAAVAIAIWALSSSLFTVSEATQALIVRLGKPIDVIVEPGLQTKLPFIDSVTAFDTRLLLLEPPAEQVILGDQKRLEVQTYTRYRIADALRFYQAVHTVEQARAQLEQIVSSVLRRELGQVGLPALTSSERVAVVARIEKEVAERARPLGVDIAEVRIHRADLPAETSQAIYDRMKSERQREAKELRAQGYEWAQQIQARADAERTVMLSEAERDSKIARGAGDAEASQILAEAYGKDPQFFKLYRSLQTYRQALAASAPTLILSPRSEFLKVFEAGPSPQSKSAPLVSDDPTGPLAADR